MFVPVGIVALEEVALAVVALETFPPDATLKVLSTFEIPNAANPKNKEPAPQSLAIIKFYLCKNEENNTFKTTDATFVNLTIRN